MHARTADAAIGRLQSKDTATGGRYAYGSSGIGSNRKVDQSRGYGHRRAARRSARDPIRSTWVNRRASPTIDSGDAIGKLVHRGFTDQSASLIEKRRDDTGMACGRLRVRKARATQARRVSRDIDGVLDGDAQAVTAQLH